MKAWRGKKAKEVTFSPGSMVLRRKGNMGHVRKFQTCWKGPFIVGRASRPGAYRLAMVDGNEEPHSWNVDTLQQYFP